MALRSRLGVSTTLVLAAAALAVLAGPAGAGVIADFEPEPASPAAPEFGWTGTDFITGLGAVGNGFGTPGAGDGDLPVANQIPNGLTVTTPFAVPGVSGGTVNAVSGATTFRNATLQIIPIGRESGGFQAAGPAASFFGNVVQPLGSAIFRLWSNDPLEAVADIENPVLLLEGIAQDGTITGIQGSNTGGTLSATVTYTSGAILQAADWPQAVGEFSWSLLGISPVLGINAQTGTLNPFVANGVGQFSGFKQVPEPATLGVLSIGGLMVALRRRKH
ncbi:MAG: PEP-CTERM sorting domain-containing protein [Planctomycetota bacterium]|nr:PEP-CTERM sorting domain-containing protein [Planctomycetota bacterium]